ncbi:sensor histidine kinase [Streptomyces qinzhouensis]|uniref:histidine kinase n=1 Tax=Streptomyces qinzhouensis TaxID=2599401 RepID=A0A5B8IPP0_9ACTN|nr:histidine kinase [Streptomyces qinzhouensis]QDY79549.1 two-component sensor histidine kinase [Streptomyces qinzhouensis]
MTFTFRSPFTAPGERSRGTWRALAETVGGGLLILLVLLPDDRLAGSLPGEALLFLGAVVVTLLAVRRHYPTASLLGAAVVLGLLPPAGLPAAVIAYTTAQQLVSHRHRAVVLSVSAALTTLVCGVFAPHIGQGGHGFGFALGGVLAATTLTVPALVGTANGQQSRLLRALHERAVAAEEVRRLTDSESRIHERSRIAAEMHDLVGHRLSLVSLHAGGLEMALRKEPPELRDEAELVRRAAGEAMRELREVLGVLGPLGRDTGPGTLTETTGTRSDIEALAEESRRGGIALRLSWDGPDLDDRPARVRRAVHRVVRESLTNVHRYAAEAHVTVAVTHTEDRVEILVRNGLPPLTAGASTGLGTGRGLIGLRERLSLLGGTLEAGPAPGGGFAVKAGIPARPDPETVITGPGTPPTGPPPAPGTGPEAGGVHRGAVSALTGFLGLAGVGVLMLLGLVLVSSARTDSDRLASPEPPRIGMTRDEVESIVYGDYELARAAATGREPARPKSVTSCIYPAEPDDVFVPSAANAVPPAEDPAADPAAVAAAAGRAAEGPGHFTLTRYCFRDDKLAAIDRFTVPVMSQTSPEESP